jgi:hypothetical protein
MFCDGKTTGTFKSVDEPLYVSFVISPKILTKFVLVYEEPSLCLQQTRRFIDD